MIKAIIFDIDGVLLDSHEANYQWYQKLFLKDRKKFVSRPVYLEKYYSMPVKEVIRDLLNLKGQELENKYQESKRLSYSTDLIKIPPGEKEIIRELAKRYQLAIVTGRFAVDSTFTITGLEQYFAVVVKFGDYQKPKPHPEPLIIALKKLHIDVNEAVYVGDSQDDLLAAKAAKMKFICFYGVSGKIFKEADANIKSFKELPEAIKRIN